MDTREIPPADGIDGTVATTALTTFRVVEALERDGPSGVSDLAAELDLAKGTVHKHLSTLQAVDYVVREGDTYRLGLGFLGLGSAVRARMEVYEVAYEPLQSLAGATEETASVMIPEHGYGVYLLRTNPEGDPWTDLREGERVPLHATAGGKAILAYMDSGQREAVLDRRGLPALTDNTTTDRAELEAELRTVHDKRMAHDRGELDPDRHCVAAPVTGGDDGAVAAVTVSGPAERMRRKSVDADFSSIVASTANSIRNRLSTTP